jgi:hypothetical protein
MAQEHSDHGESAEKNTKQQASPDPGNKTGSPPLDEEEWKGTVLRAARKVLNALRRKPFSVKRPHLPVFDHTFPHSVESARDSTT